MTWDSSAKNQKIIDGVVVLSEFDADTLQTPPQDKIYLYAEDNGLGETVVKIKDSENTEKEFATTDASSLTEGTLSAARLPVVTGRDALLAAREESTGGAISISNPVANLGLDIVHYWDCESLTAVVGSDLTLTTGARSHRPTRNGLGLWFPRTPSTYYAAAQGSFNGSAAWSCFLRVVPWKTAQTINIFGQYVGGSNNRCFMLIYAAGKFQLLTSADGTSGTVTTIETSAAIYSGGFEHCVAFGWDGVDTVYLEINKRERVTATVAGVYNATASFEVGRVGAGNAFNGIVDEIYVCDDYYSTWPDALWNKGFGFSQTRQPYAYDGLLAEYNADGNYTRTESPRVWICMGQSNMLGSGGVSINASAPFPLEGPDDRVQYTSFVSGGHDLSTWGALVPQYSTSGVFPAAVSVMLASAAYAFGRALADRGALNIHVTRYAIGGTSLAVDWAASGATWLAAKAFIDARIAELTTPSIDGIFWWQGETDSNTEAYANAYEANFTAALARWRTAWGASLPVIAVLPWNAGAYRDTVRAAIFKVAQADGNVRVIDARGLRIIDTTHVCPEGLRAIGEQAARLVDIGNQA